MARILYCHPSQTRYGYHIFTDLDFWDARRVLGGLAVVKRNFAKNPPGDEFPTQVVAPFLDRADRETIARRLERSIVSPPRHVIVNSILSKGYFEFDPAAYFPAHWSSSLMLHFTYRRLPLRQPALNSPYRKVRLWWNKGKIRVESILRDGKSDPVIRTKKDSQGRRFAPSCF